MIRSPYYELLWVEKSSLVFLSRSAIIFKFDLKNEEMKSLLIVIDGSFGRHWYFNRIIMYFLLLRKIWIANALTYDDGFWILLGNARALNFWIFQTPPKAIGYFDPRGRPTVTAGSDHYFRTCCLSVRPHFSKQNQFQAKTMFTTGETVGLAEWIMDDTCLVSLFSEVSALKWVKKNRRILFPKHFYYFPLKN